MEYHDLRPTTYFSVFGKIRFRRHYFHASGQEGFCPLDAELSLPSRCYSDLLRDWAEYSITTESYNESIKVLKRILNLSISKLALETGVLEDAADVEAFYEQRTVPSPEAEGSILVVQADGKGVPMVRTDSPPQSARRGKGEKRTKKKEAVVTAIYTIEPYFRTPQEVADALLHGSAEESEGQFTTPSRTERPAPVGKEVRATLAGKDIAFECLTQRVAQREGEHIQHRVALTDGAEPLQCQVKDRLPMFILILDIIHAVEYLWKAANALLGETSPDRTAWVQEYLLCILSGRATDVIQTLEERVQDLSLSTPNTRPSTRRLVTIDATCPTCAMTSISRYAGPLAQVSLKVPVVTWLKIAWNNPQCAGLSWAHRLSWTYVRFASMTTGMITNSSIGVANISDSTIHVLLPYLWPRYLPLVK
jgi:hypothetical protein